MDCDPLEFTSDRPWSSMRYFDDRKLRTWCDLKFWDGKRTFLKLPDDIQLLVGLSVS
jgi:hypothetical protein